MLSSSFYHVFAHIFKLSSFHHLTTLEIMHSSSITKLIIPTLVDKGTEPLIFQVGIN